MLKIYKYFQEKVMGEYHVSNMMNWKHRDTFFGLYMLFHYFLTKISWYSWTINNICDVRCKWTKIHFKSTRNFTFSGEKNRRKSKISCNKLYWISPSLIFTHDKFNSAPHFNLKWNLGHQQFIEFGVVEQLSELYSYNTEPWERFGR